MTDVRQRLEPARPRPLTDELRRATTADATYRGAVALILAVLAAVLTWNAYEYPSYGGYDTSQNQEYAATLVRDWTLPDTSERSAYYKPPGYYLLAGLALRVGEELGLEDPWKAAQYLNVAVVLASALFVLALARLLWPGRRSLHVAALAFFALVPVVPKTAAMIHPASMGLLFSTAALYVSARLIVRRRLGWRAGAGLGLLLIAGVLVMVSNLWTYAVVLGVLVAAALFQRADRRRLLVTAASVVLVTVVLAAPWYVRQTVTYGDPIFGGRTTAVEPVWERRPASFYTGLGWPDVFTRPYRPAFVNELVPTTYTELWGDYFGVFAWGASTPPDEAVEAELTQQNELGLLPTAVAVGGWLALSIALLRRRRLAEAPAQLLVAALPAVALLGYLYYAIAYVTPDGDVLKATFMLPAAPAWALAFGYGASRLLARRAVRPALVVALLGIALLDLRFVVFHDPLVF